eukprot:15729789-Heterocapsa_arctica.AAC.1
MEDSLATLLLAFYVRVGYGMAAVLSEAGLASVPIEIRTDGENAMRSVAADIASRRSPVPTLTEVTPSYSSSSHGACERFSETVSGLVRTLKASVEKSLKYEVRASHHMFSYMVMHAVWLYNRYQVRRNGVIPYEQ